MASGSSSTARWRGGWGGLGADLGVRADGPQGLVGQLSQAVAFLTLAGLVLAATAAVAQRYGGAWWLWPPYLLAGVLTAVLTVKRWQTCFGPAKQPEPTSILAGPEVEPAGTRQTATGTRS